MKITEYNLLLVRFRIFSLRLDCKKTETLSELRNYNRTDKDIFGWYVLLL